MRIKKIIKNIRHSFGVSDSKQDRAVLFICIGIALVFWAFVKLSQIYAIDVEVGLSYQVPEGEAFLEAPPKKIIATLEGTGWDLLSPYFNKMSTAVEIDVMRRYISSSDLSTKISSSVEDFGLSLKRVNPDYLVLSLQEASSKKVPIELNSQLKIAAQHYIRDSIIIVPDSVLVSGPQSLIDSLQVWETQLLELNNLDKPTTRIVSLANSYGNLIQLDTNEVTVTIQVEQVAEKKLFVPIRIKNYEDSLRIFPNKIQLNVSVGLSDFYIIKTEDFVVEVDMKDIDINPENNSVPIQVTQYPTSVRALHFSPKSVEYFKVKEAEEVSETENQ